MRKQVAVLAGGLGMRLRPFTETCPKPMVQVLGQPFLHWQILDLKEQGYTDFVFLVAYLGEQIQSHFEDGSKWGVHIEYAFESQPLGTGGAIRNALDLLEDDFLIANGDSFLRAPLDDLAGFFDEGRFDALVTVHSNRDTRNLGSHVPNNLLVQNQIVTAYKKGAGLSEGYNFVDSGIYAVKRDLFSRFDKGEKFQLEDVFQSLIPKRSYGAFEVTSRFYDIGTPERLLEFESYVGSELRAGRLNGCEPKGVP